MKKHQYRFISCFISTSMMFSLMDSPRSIASGCERNNDERIATLHDEIANLSIEDYSTLNDFAMREGHSSIDAMIESFRSETIVYPPQSRIKDLDDSGSVNIADGIAFAAFLHGSYLYAYSYEELDVNGDYLLDENDLTAYLQYLSAYSTYSAHGQLQSVDYNFEHRSYTKYDYTTGTKSTYVLQDSTMLSAMSLSSTNELPLSDNDEGENSEPSLSRDVSDLPSSCDDRIVRIGEETVPGVPTYQDTGFIVDHHVIATAGHCVYNRGAAESLKFNPYRTVYAFTYQQNQDGTYSEVPHKLTVQYVAVPTAYTTCSNADRKWWDYGIIVVEEDLLQDYHAFSLGLVVEGAPRSKNNEPGAFDTTVIGFHGANELPRYLTGTLYDYNLYRMTVQSSIPYGGASGCAVYCDDGTLDVVIGIIQSTGKHGMVISRPLLEFYYHA